VYQHNVQWFGSHNWKTQLPWTPTLILPEGSSCSQTGWNQTNVLLRCSVTASRVLLNAPVVLDQNTRISWTEKSCLQNATKSDYLNLPISEVLGQLTASPKLFCSTLTLDRYSPVVMILTSISPSTIWKTIILLYILIQAFQWIYSSVGIYIHLIIYKLVGIYSIFCSILSHHKYKSDNCFDGFNILNRHVHLRVSANMIQISTQPESIFFMIDGEWLPCGSMRIM